MAKLNAREILARQDSHLQLIEFREDKRAFKTSKGSFILQDHAQKCVENGIIDFNEDGDTIILNKGSRFFVKNQLVFFTDKEEVGSFSPW